MNKQLSAIFSILVLLASPLCWSSAYAQISVKPCWQCNLTSTDPCVRVCMDSLFRYSRASVQEEKLNPGMDDFVESGFEESAVSAAPRSGVSLGNTQCNADASGVTQNCNVDTANLGDSGENSLGDLYFEPGDRQMGLTVNAVTAGMDDAMRSEAFDAIYDGALAKPGTIKRIAYGLTEPIVADSVDDEIDFAIDQVRAQTEAEANLFMKASANPEVGEFALGTFNDCVQAEITKSRAAGNQVGWLAASHTCLGGQRIASLNGTTMPVASFVETAGFSAQSSKNHELSNPNVVPGGNANTLCQGETNDNDCVSALGYIVNQAMDDIHNNQPSGQVGGANNNKLAMENFLKSARRLIGDVNITFSSAGRDVFAGPSGPAVPGGGGATIGQTSKVARVFKVEHVPPMFDGKIDATGVLAGPDWYLKSITRQVYSSVMTILHYQCVSYSELTTLGSTAPTDMAFPADVNPYDMYGWYKDEDIWKRDDIRVDNLTGAVQCTGAPWVTCSGSGAGTQVSINRLMLEASAPGIGFNKAISDAMFHYFLIHENYISWNSGGGSGCSGGVCTGPPSAGGLDPLNCNQLIPSGEWGVDNIMTGNIIRKDMPRLVRVVFTYSLRVATQKLWEMFDQLERALGSITGGTHTKLAKRYFVELMDKQAGLAVAKGKMENLRLYNRFIEGIYQDRHNNIGSNDLFATVMQAGAANKGGANPAF